MKTSIRFYIEDIKKYKELEVLIPQDAFCKRRYGTNYIQFSDENGFMVLQPETFLSKNLLAELNKVATQVTLLVYTVERELMTKIFSGERKSFHLEVGDLKVSGLHGAAGSYDLLFASDSSKKIFEAFRGLVPGIFHEGFSKIFPVLREMSFTQKARILFGI